MKNISIAYSTVIDNPSDRVLKISDAFGVGINEKHIHSITQDFDMPDEFNVVYITGMSGSGKSSLLNYLKEMYDFREPKIDIDSDEPIIDLIGIDLEEALFLLNIVGLGDAHLYVKSYKCLSDGQKYRYKIAKLIESNQKIWCIDEFCSFLDRTTANIVSYNVQKIARKLNKKVIVATAHNDLHKYLKPDYVLDFNNGEGLNCIKEEYDRVNPFTEDIRIEKATIDEYRKLGKYHYKNKDAKFVKHIYKMMYKDLMIGVSVFSMPSQQLVGRNVYFNKKYINERGIPVLSEVNKDFLVNSRIIIHPMFRGVGLGGEMVKRTCSIIDRPYIEIVSTMSKYNKFLEVAGCEYVCDNNTEDKMKKEAKVRALFEKYNLKYEFIISPKYCDKILSTIPNDELKNTIYGILRPNYFNNRARFKKYGIDFQTKKEFMEQPLNAELLSLAKCNTTQYYIWDNIKKGMYKEDN